MESWIPVRAHSDMLVEARYVGTKGTKLLQALAFNQGYDLNSPATPDAIFKRFNDAYDAAYQKQLQLRAMRLSLTARCAPPRHSGSGARNRVRFPQFGPGWRTRLQSEQRRRRLIRV